MKANLWPVAIITYFAVFIGGIIVWVSFAVRHEDQLVRADYYQEELGYQNQLDRLARTAAVRSEIGLDCNPATGVLRVQLPRSQSSAITNGMIHFYRPSDAGLDSEKPLRLDASGAQSFSLADLAPGSWKVRLNWSAGGAEYYFESRLFVGPTGSPWLR